jgi:hypothetical protein
MHIEHVDTTEWDSALPDTGFDVFHTSAALEVLDRHTAGDLQLFAGYKGDQPVGLFPLVVQRRTVGKAGLSPPPSMGVPRLGPLVMPASPKRRKREKLNRQFTQGVLERAGFDGSRSLLRAVCTPDYADPRPFTWEGLDVEAVFTYRLETAGRTTEEILASFSKSLRRDIRDGHDLDIDVRIDDPEGTRLVHEQTATRYGEQDRSYPLEWDYVDDLTQALMADDRCRVYTAHERDGTFLSGVTVLYSNDAAYFWQGGARTTHENVSLNSHLHWQILTDIVDDPPRESVTQYDLMGANTERLCRYKSKFGADLVPYYVVETDSTQMTLAKKAYRLVGR